MNKNFFEILLIADNPADICLTQEVLKNNKVKNNIRVIMNGFEALSCLRQEGKYENVPRPDLILFGLKMSGKKKHKALELIKEDEELNRIPLILLTTFYHLWYS